MTAPRPMIDPDLLAAACAHAIAVHDGQLRKGTDVPYVGHVLSVTALVLEHGGSADQAVAAALHDVAEDGGGQAQLAEVRRRFGDTVAGLVADLSDATPAPGETKGPWEERKRAHHEHLGELVARRSPAVLVAACDSLHNLRAIGADLDDPEVGVAVFDRFNAPTPAATVWNHEERLRRYRAAGDLVPPRLLRALEAAFARVQDGAAAVDG